MIEIIVILVVFSVVFFWPYYWYKFHPEFSYTEKYISYGFRYKLKATKHDGSEFEVSYSDFIVTYDFILEEDNGCRGKIYKRDVGQLFLSLLKGGILIENEGHKITDVELIGKSVRTISDSIKVKTRNKKDRQYEKKGKVIELKNDDIKLEDIPDDVKVEYEKLKV